MCPPSNKKLSRQTSVQSSWLTVPGSHSPESNGATSSQLDLLLVPGLKVWIFYHFTVEFRGSYRFSNGIKGSGFGQIELASKNIKVLKCVLSNEETKYKKEISKVEQYFDGDHFK